MARDMKKADALKFVKQAEEFLAAAMESFESGRYNAATFNAIQSMLNANDAATIYHLGQRASSDHREALTLHANVAKIVKDISQKSRLSQAFDLRSDAGYGGDVMIDSDAEKAIKNASRFLDWVKEKIK
ncbi:MAG: HEPN domain-containing protein [Thermoplasmata archaeon]|nr:HEPN domain-containing protein [Thermoplasmata archaeon]